MERDTIAAMPADTLEEWALYALVGHSVQERRVRGLCPREFGIRSCWLQVPHVAQETPEALSERQHAASRLREAVANSSPDLSEE